MNRLAASLTVDLRIQWRNGLYFVSLIALLTTAALLRYAIPDSHRLWAAAGLFYLAAVQSFYFVAGLVLFEKGERSLDALAVTPLRSFDYVCSKNASIAIMVGFELTAACLLSLGLSVNYLWFLAGVASSSFVYGLAGFIVVARFRSITDFLLPGALVSSVMELNALDYFGLVPSAAFLLWPTHPPLALFRLAVEPFDLGLAAYGLLGSSIWIALLFVWARKAFQRFIVMRKGM